MSANVEPEAQAGRCLEWKGLLKPCEF